MNRKQLIVLGVCVALCLLVGIGLWQTSHDLRYTRINLVTHPKGIMGTTCTIAAIVDSAERDKAEKAMKNAEDIIRYLEFKLSTWLENSEISRLNHSGKSRLSNSTRNVVNMAKEAAVYTHGAFDATCSPLIRLWREAEEENRVPSPRQIAHAREASNWESFTITKTAMQKNHSTASLDLGGIAKGFAIDKALNMLRQEKIHGGLVDIGGDLACYRKENIEGTWAVGIQDPFGKGTIASLGLRNGAVCTSGNYERFFTIQGKRYSHIIDPRTGYPAEITPSVTVIAPLAAHADVWATALSVTGKDGFDFLPKTIHSMVIEGTKEKPSFHQTPGFRDYLVKPLNTK